MDIKEWGATGVLVVGGAVYGISQYGLNDVMSEDLRHISEVSAQERPAYMDGVVAEFREAFDSYAVETETYIFVGMSEFSTAPVDGGFIEVVTQEEPVPYEEIKGIAAQMEVNGFCAQDEMTMFTSKGWTYRFSMKDSKNRQVYAIVCEPVHARLRGTS